jgi:ubiquitin-protein ligase
MIVSQFALTNLVFHVSISTRNRLQNDLKGIKELSDISVELTETPSCAIISFNVPVADMPNRFLVQVPKFYPHNPPVIKLCDSSFHSISRYWDGTGRVLHDGLSINWTAMNSLRDVIDILRCIRSSVLEEKITNRMTAYSFDGVMDIS